MDCEVLMRKMRTVESNGSQKDDKTVSSLLQKLSFTDAKEIIWNKPFDWRSFDSYHQCRQLLPSFIHSFTQPAMSTSCSQCSYGGKSAVTKILELLEEEVDSQLRHMARNPLPAGLFCSFLFNSWRFRCTIMNVFLASNLNPCSCDEMKCGKSCT